MCAKRITTPAGDVRSRIAAYFTRATWCVLPDGHDGPCVGVTVSNRKDTKR